MGGKWKKNYRKCWGIWKILRKMLGNMDKCEEHAGGYGKKHCKSKVYAPNNAGSSFVSQQYMQFMPKKNSFCFKNENAIYIFQPKKKSSQTEFYHTGEACKLPTNMRLWQNVHVCRFYVGFLIWISKTMVSNAEKYK